MNRAPHDEPDSKDHLVVDRTGLPLAVTHESTQLLPLIDAIPPVIGPRRSAGRPHKRPTTLHADEGHDSSDRHGALRSRGITPCIARWGIDSSEWLGRHRWGAERTLSWLLGCRA